MNVYITKERVWWTVEGEDKPSRTYFNNFVNNMTNEVVRVNFTNYENVNIVANTDDITYVKIEHNNTVYYYYTDSIENILNNGYNYRLRLDIYTTYTLPLLDSLEQNKVPVKLVRSLIDEPERITLVDTLLESVPKSYTGIKYAKREFNKDSSGYWYYKDNFKIKHFNELLNPVVYGVFTDMKVGQFTQPYVFIPLIDSRTLSTDSVEVIINGQTKQVHNTDTIIGTMSMTDFSNNFKGYYILPNLLYFSNNVYVQNYKVGAVGNRDVLVVQVPLFNFKIDDLRLPLIPAVKGVAAGSLYLSDIQMIPYLELKYYDNVLSAEMWGTLDTNEFRYDIRNLLYSFVGAGQLVYNVDRLPLNSSLIRLPYQLPSVINNYQQYVNSTYNSVNTGFQNNIINTALGFAGNGIASYNILQGGYRGGITPLDAISGVSKVSQNARQIRASYKDARQRLQPSINLSTIEDNKWVRIALQNSCFEFVEYKELTTETLSLMNNTLYYYGYFLPQMNTLTYAMSLKRVEGFTYISLEQDYTENLINIYVDKKTPKKYYYDINYSLSGGIRIWDKIPEYKI